MDDTIATASATALTRALRRREISSRELLELYLDRHRGIGRQLNAVVTVDAAGAHAAARAADERLARGEHSPLLGLPMTVKDALATAGMRSTGGAVELADHVPDHDAEVVARVRGAGAVVFAKTNLPRWSADVQATNEIFGTTNNPWDLERGPGGSSGGASAAVAAGLTGADLGTDIGGSVRLPAHFAGVCGHKPTFGIVPQLGYISHPTYPVSEPDINVVGPIARSVDDLSLLMNVIAGPTVDRADGWRLELPESRHERLADFRIAAHLDDPAVPVGAEVAAVIEAACGSLEAAGASIDRSAWPDSVAFRDVIDLGLPLISAATSPGRDEQQFESMRAIALEPAGHAPSLQMRAAATAMFHRDWLLAVERRQGHRRRWQDFFNRYDVLLAPVAITTAFPHVIEGNLYTRTLDVGGDTRAYHELIMWTSQFGYVGLPATVVPIGRSDRGLPVGLQIVGPHYGDHTALAFARLVERLLGGYEVPPIAQQSGTT